MRGKLTQPTHRRAQGNSPCSKHYTWAILTVWLTNQQSRVGDGGAGETRKCERVIKSPRHSRIYYVQYIIVRACNRENDVHLRHQHRDNSPCPVRQDIDDE